MSETLNRWIKYQRNNDSKFELTPMEVNQLLDELLSDLHSSWYWLDRLRHPQGLVLQEKYKFTQKKERI